MGKLHRICGLMIALILIVGMAEPCLAADTSKRVIRVAMLEYPNFIDYDESDAPTGFACDYLKKIAGYTGWEYEYIPMSFAEAQKALVSGEVDIVPGSQYTEERAQMYDYSENSMSTNSNVLCVRANDTGYFYNDYDAIEGKRIGVMAGSIRSQQLEELLRRKGVTATLCEFETNETEQEALEAGEVDVVLMSSIRCTPDYRIIASFAPSDVYFTSTPTDPSIKRGIDEAMGEILSVNPYYNMELYEKHYGDIPTAYAFTVEEREYMEQAGEITVAVSTDMQPYEYYDKKTNSFKGMSIDYFEKISEMTGIQFHYVERGDADTTTAQLVDGTLQIISNIAADSEATLTYPVTLTDTYYASSTELVYHKSIANPLDTSCKIILKSGFPLYQKLAQSRGYENIVYCDSFEECIREVNEGKADVTYLPGYTADRMLDHEYLRDVKELSAPIAEFDCAIGVSNQCDERLVAVINKALAALIPSEETAIFTKEIADNKDPNTLQDVLYGNLIMILSCILVISIGIGVFTARSAYRRKKLNIELMEARDAAQIANAAKSDFLSRMSHDMRTPMNGIMGLISLTQDLADIPPEARDNLQAIDESSRYLLNLINDVLDMNKIEADKLTLHPEVINADVFVHGLLKSIRALADEKQIRLSYAPMSLKEKYIRADKMRLEQIFVNILSNAVKFTDIGGTIQMEAEELAYKEQYVNVRVSVEDSGVGMSEEFLPHLFEPFAQEKKTAQLNYGGTGLGMSIVKNLVDLMGGTIEAESRVGVGTKITVYLELECVEQEESMPQQAEVQDTQILENKRALLVEDHPLNTQIAVKLLEKKKMIVEHAADGQIAVDMFEQSEEHYYDVILMDIRMPVMGGLEAAKTIRAIDREDAKEVPIIAMTANAFAEDVQKSLDAGMNAHLAKPINPTQLYETIAENLGKDRVS